MWSDAHALRPPLKADGAIGAIAVDVVIEVRHYAG